MWACKMGRVLFQFDTEERSNGLKSHQDLMLKWEDSGFPAKKMYGNSKLLGYGYHAIAK